LMLLINIHAISLIVAIEMVWRIIKQLS
jgi:hypothetical protein